MTETLTLPPGNMGLPLIGETPALARNVFGFIEERRKLHGPVFKTNVLGRKTIFLSGIAGAEVFYNPENIDRANAHPSSVVKLFGGINMEMFDGPRHLALKSMALTAFDRAAIAGYLPDMQRLIEATLARLATAGEFSAVSEMRRLAIETICCNVLGIYPGPDSESMTRDYGLVIDGLTSMPVPLPGTRYSRAKAARDRLLPRTRAVICERRTRPGTDGLSRLLTARAADGHTYTDEEALLEAHHIVIAGFFVHTLMAEPFRQLAEQPQLRERCLAEVREHAPAGALTIEALDRLQFSTQVILEAKRWVPAVPVAFGCARRAFACGGFQVPEGWTVYLALSLNNRDPAIYTDPNRFDPERFGPERAEHRKHPLAFIPQGAEPPTGHRCLGLDYSTYLSLAFLTLLVRGYDWQLPPQDLDYVWNAFPPRPRGELRVSLRARV